LKRVALKTTERFRTKL